MMRMTRRDFFGTTAMGAALSMMGTRSLFADNCGGFKTKLYKAFICSEPTEDNLKAHAEAGFEGFEVTNWNQTEEEIKAGKKMADDYGLRVHSIMRGWASLDASDEAERKASLETIRIAIRNAALYGADAILLVPGRIGTLDGKGYPIPNPGDLHIEFDPETTMISKVVDGDNTPYQPYINEHNRVAQQTFDDLQEVIPTAAYYGVTIALENVWNNLWLLPDIFAAYVKRFNNYWVKAYFDLGNHTKYAPASDWLRALGNEYIAKLHLKEFKIEEGNPNTMFDGFVGFGTGSVDWKAVRKTIDEIGYNGWVSYEENAYDAAGYGKRMDQWIKGEDVQG